MTKRQQRKLFALFNELSDFVEREPTYFHGWVHGRYRVKSLHDLTQVQIDEIIRLFEKSIHKYQREKRDLKEQEIERHGLGLHNA